MAARDRIAGIVTGHNRVTAVALLAAVLVMAAGLPAVGSSAGVDQFQPEGEAARALEYADANFTSTGGEASTLQVVVRDGNALDKETLVDTLEFQRAVRRNATVGEHLVADRPTAGIANVVATAASRQRGERTAAAADRTRPPLSTQLAALRAANESEIDAILASVLAADAADSDPGAFAYLPGSTNPGATQRRRPGSSSVTRRAATTPRRPHPRGSCRHRRRRVLSPTRRSTARRRRRTGAAC